MTWFYRKSGPCPRNIKESNNLYHHLFSLPGSGSWGEQPTNITSRGFQSPWTSQSAKTQGKRSFLTSKEIHGWCSWMLTDSLFFHFPTFYASSKSPRSIFSSFLPLSHSCFPFLVWFLPLYLLCFLQKPAESCPDNTANYFFLRPPVWRQHWSNRTPVTLLLKLSVEEVKLCKILKHIEKYFIANRNFQMILITIADYVVS